MQACHRACIGGREKGVADKATPAERGTLRQLRNEAEECQIVVTLEGTTSESLSLHSYLGKLGCDVMFARAEATSIESVDKWDSPEIAEFPWLIVRPAYGERGGPTIDTMTLAAQRVAAEAFADETACTRRRNSWLVTFPIAEIAGLYLWFVFLPGKGGAIEAAHVELHDKQAFIASIDRVRAGIRHVEGEIETTKEYCRRWCRTDSADSTDMAALFGIIAELLKSSCVVTTRFTPKAGTHLESCAEGTAAHLGVVGDVLPQ